MNEGGENKYLIPGAVLVAGLLIAGAFVYINRGPSDVGSEATPVGGQEEQEQPDGQLRAITEDDHILGNPGAPIVIVEYSDFECPFCKNFHETMHRIIDEYGKDGKVAWVYRHFPLPQLHPKAPREAEASECAAELGGNDGFWAYADRIFEITPSNNGLDLDLLPQIAEDIGLDRDAFEECLNSERHSANVEEQYNDAIASGGTGTPYSIVLLSDGQAIPVNGALPYESLKRMIDDTLPQLEQLEQEPQVGEEN